MPNNAGTANCVTVVSGGDDQAVQVAVITVQSAAAADVSNHRVQLSLLCRCRVVSAHTSAIKVSRV